MKPSYKKFILMLTINFIIMFALTYVMVNVYEDIYLNLNRAYMAGIMVASMTIIMLLFMRPMYPNRKINALIIIISATLVVGIFSLIRTQSGINDTQFLRAMITHHSSAILMCEQSSIDDPEILDLCENIVRTQQVEIDQMKDILDRLR